METTRVFSGSSGETELTVRAALPDDLNAVERLQGEVCAALRDPRLFAATSREELYESLCEDAGTVLTRDGRIIACMLTVLNRETPRNLADKAGLKRAECVTLDTVFVHPDFRGLGLQRYLIAVCEDIARTRGAKRVLCTVSPDNRFSLNNFMSLGYAIAARCTLYGGKDRYVLGKEL